MPVEGPTNDINGGFSAAEQEFSINFTKVKFSLSLYYNGDNSYLFINGIYKIKANGKNVYLPTHHFLWSIPGKFEKSEKCRVRRSII